MENFILDAILDPFEKRQVFRRIGYKLKYDVCMAELRASFLIFNKNKQLFNLMINFNNRLYNNNNNNKMDTSID
jgi:hypothetical protein